MFLSPTCIGINEEAYGDHPSPIGYGQTISQPYIVAYMIAKLGLKPGEAVLEIGAGCGYEAAILAELGMRVMRLKSSPNWRNTRAEFWNARGMRIA